MVRVPSKTTPRAEVRCPHCSHTFKLLEILEQLVPELEVVEPQSDIQGPIIETDVRTENGKFVVPSQLSNGARRRNRRGSSTRTPANHSSTDENTLDEIKLASVTEPDVVVAVTEPTPRPLSPRESRSNERREKIRSRSRRRGKGAAEASSPMVEAVKVILGAVMAIPIAYLLVFWVFRADPLDLGPSLSKSVPFLVPAQFRDTLEIDNTSDTETSETQEQEKTKMPRVIDPDSPEGGLAIPMIDPELIGRN